MDIVQIPLLRDNYGYLIVCRETGEAAVVDPSEAEPVIARLEAERVRPVAILNTHHHRDHTGGNEALLARYPGMRVYGHRTDQARIPGLNRPLDEGDEVEIGKWRGRVLFIPGHTRGHVAYLFERSLFCGDTLFAAGCGRLFEGTAAEMLSSLERLKSLPEETLVYCGHEYTQKNLEFALTVEPRNRDVASRLEVVRGLRAAGKSTVPSTIGAEKKTNPFFRSDSAEIHATLEKGCPGLARDRLAVFTRLRELKDRF
jgi:hydroxyacylglutathione hydrolase